MSERVISKDDFSIWKDEPVTKAFFDAAEERISDAKDLLATQAGLDPINDSFYRGFIYAYTEIGEFKVED